jgi:hypothetical protein
MTGSEQPVAARLVILASVMIAVGAIAIGVAVPFGILPLSLAVLALLTCVVSSLVAHVAGEYPSGHEFFMARLTASMSIRTGLPLLVVLFAKLSDRIPFKPAFVFYIILFYLVGLFADVALHMWRSQAAE